MVSSNISKWLKDATSKLSSANIATARLDCLVLLEDATGKDRAWLLSHPEYNLQGSVLKKLNTKVVQRAQHIPLAYIRGKAEFYGREFAVNEHTLVPRPETETMIDILTHAVIPALEPEPKSKGWIPNQGRDDTGVILVDIGTGSGALAITAKLEMPTANVIATDIDKKCLETARLNAQKLGADIAFLHGDLLKPVIEFRSGTSAVDTSITVLLCNLPYVPDNFHINTAATHEPKHAIFGGTDGLDLYRQLFKQIRSGGWQPAYILIESMPPQHEVLLGIAKAAGYSLQKTDDFIQSYSLSPQP